MDRLAWALTLDALGFEGEIDHHDRVLLDDAYQENDADDSDDVEARSHYVERQQRSNACGPKGGNDRDRMGEALVEHPEHDIDRCNRGEDQVDLVRQRSLERRKGALVGSGKIYGQPDVGLRPLDFGHRAIE